jgi:hypothetical protein
VYRRIFAAQLGVRIAERDPLAAFREDSAVYHDDVGDYAASEPMMDGTATALLPWTLCSAR